MILATISKNCVQWCTRMISNVSVKCIHVSERKVLWCMQCNCVFTISQQTKLVMCCWLCVIGLFLINVDKQNYHMSFYLMNSVMDNLFIYHVTRQKTATSFYATWSITLSTPPRLPHMAVKKLALLRRDLVVYQSSFIHSQRFGRHNLNLILKKQQQLKFSWITFKRISKILKILEINLQFSMAQNLSECSLHQKKYIAYVRKYSRINFFWVDVWLLMQRGIRMNNEIFIKELCLGELMILSCSTRKITVFHTLLSAIREYIYEMNADSASMNMTWLCEQQSGSVSNWKTMK